MMEEELEEEFLHLRKSFGEEMERIFEKYANIRDEGEGYLLEEIEQFYNSDTEYEIEEQQQLLKLKEQSIMVEEQPIMVEEQPIKVKEQPIKMEEQEAESVEQQQEVDHLLLKQQQQPCYPCIHRIQISNKRISKLPKDILATNYVDRTDKAVKIRRSRSGAHKHTTRVHSIRHHPYYHTIVEHLYAPVYKHVLHAHS